MISPDFYGDLLAFKDVLNETVQEWEPEPLVTASAEWSRDANPGHKLTLGLSIRIGDGVPGGVPMVQPERAAAKFAESWGRSGTYKLHYHFRPLAPIEEDVFACRFLKFSYLSSLIRAAEADPIGSRKTYGNIGREHPLHQHRPEGWFDWNKDYDYNLHTGKSTYVGRLIAFGDNIKALPQDLDGSHPDHWKRRSLESDALDGIELALEAAGRALLPYLGRGLSYMWIREFLKQQSEFMEALGIIRMLETSLDTIYRSHIRTGPDGADDTRKIVAQVERLLKREAVLNGQQSYSVASLMTKVYSGIRMKSAPADKAGDKGKRFEVDVADRFRKLGYAVQTTPVTGDFGADLLVEKDEIRFVVQCKNLSGPAGVKAVQEVTAARRKYACDYAVVVSSHGFTAAAHELALDNNVILRSADYLDNLVG